MRPDIRAYSILRRVFVRARVLAHVRAFCRDGKVDQNEAFQLVLQMYIQINRQAPIEPPSKELV